MQRLSRSRLPLTRISKALHDFATRVLATALIAVWALGAAPAHAQLTAKERGQALRLANELEARLDQSCQPMVNQIKAILNDFTTFQTIRSEIAVGYKADIRATVADLERPFLKLEQEYEAFKLQALAENILIDEFTAEDIRDPELDDENIFGIPMAGLALSPKPLKAVRELTPKFNALRLRYDALVAAHQKRAKRMAANFNRKLLADFNKLDEIGLRIRTQKETLNRTFSEADGPFAHCLGYSLNTRDQVGKIIGILARVTPQDKVLGLNVPTPERVENIAERLVQLGVLEAPAEPIVEIKRDGEKFLTLFAELLEARNEGDAVMVRVEAMNAVTHVLETAKNFTYGMFLGPFEPFTRDDLTLTQAFYQAGKELTVGMVQGAIQSFETLIENEIERGTEIYEALDSGDRRAARGFVDLGGAMGAMLSQAKNAMNVMATTGTPKRSDHGSGIVGLVGYVEDLREFNAALEFLGDETAENVRIFNRAVDTWMAVFQIALTFEGGKAGIKSVKNLSGNIKSQGAVKGTLSFTVERAQALVDQGRARFKQAKDIARKGKDSIVASKNLLSRKKLGEDVPADAEAIANKVLDEQKRVEEALEANESIKTSLKFIDKETKAAKEFSGADFASQVLGARGKPKPRPVRDGQEATPTLIIEPDGPANGLRDLGLVEGSTVGKPDLPTVLTPDPDAPFNPTIEIAPTAETFRLNNGRSIEIEFGGESKSGTISDVFLADGTVVKLIKVNDATSPLATPEQRAAAQIAADQFAADSANRITEAADALNALDSALDGVGIGVTNFLGSKKITVKVKDVDANGNVTFRDEVRIAQVFERFDTKTKNNEIVQGFAEDILNQQGAFTSGQVKAIVLGKILLADFGILLRDFKPDNFGLIKIGEPDAWKIHITDVDLIRRLGDTKTAKGRKKADTPEDFRRLAEIRLRGKDTLANRAEDARVRPDGTQQFEGNIGASKEGLDIGIADSKGDGTFDIDTGNRLANELLDKFVKDPDGAIKDIFGSDEASLAALNRKRDLIKKQGEERAQQLRDEQASAEGETRAEAERVANENAIDQSIATELPSLVFDDSAPNLGEGGFNFDPAANVNGEIGNATAFDVPDSSTFLLETDGGVSNVDTFNTNGLDIQGLGPDTGDADSSFGTGQQDFGSLFGDLFKDQDGNNSGSGGDAPSTDGGS